MALNVFVEGSVSRQLPIPDTDNDNGGIRLGRYHDQYVIPTVQKSHALADEGSYFVTTNPTPGTGIVFTAAAQTAFSDTTPSLVVKNNDAASNTNYKRLHLDYIKLLVTAAGTAGVALHVAMKVDNVNRYTSGGSSLSPVSPNSDWASALSVAQIWCGAITAPAAGPSARLIGRGCLRGAIPVVNDQYILNFGAVETAVSASALGGTGIVAQVFSFPPVVLGPQHFFVLSPWLPSQSGAPSVEIEMGWWER